MNGRTGFLNPAAGVALALAHTQQMTQRFVSLFLSQYSRVSWTLFFLTKKREWQMVQCHMNSVSLSSDYNSYNLAEDERRKNKNRCRIESKLYAAWDLRTEWIKCSHASQTKERPVQAIQRVPCYVKHKWSAWEDRGPPFQGEDISLFWCHCTWHTTQRIIRTLHHAGKIHERACELCYTSVKAL